MMMFLNRCIILSSLFLLGCVGASVFAASTGGGVLSKYVGESIENLDLLENSPKVPKFPKSSQKDMKIAPAEKLNN